MDLAGGCRLRFPGGRTKALSMSYDDGSEHDRRLVALFNAHGLRGTFHLPSSMLGAPHRIARDEVAPLYAGHEVACHGATHVDLTQLDDPGVRRELEDDREVLTALTGQPVRGLAYAFGAHDARIERLAAEAGFAYGRGISDSRDFALPAAPLALTATCHHGEALAFGEALLAEPPDRLAWMRVRGHSFELDGFLTADPRKDWAYMEAFCRQMGGAEDLWPASLITVIEYLAAAAGLSVGDAGRQIRNPSPLSVWIAAADGRVAAIPPGAARTIAAG